MNIFESQTCFFKQKNFPNFDKKMSKKAKDKVTF